MATLTIQQGVIRQLQRQGELKEIATNEYLRNTYNDNFIYIQNKFFEGQANLARLMNSGTGIGKGVCDTYANYVSTPTWELGFELRQPIVDYCALGFSTLQMTSVDGVWGLTYQPAENYYREGEDHVILRNYEKQEDQTTNTYTLLQRFSVGRITNTLYKNLGLSFTTMEEVPLDTIPETTGLEPEQMTGLDMNALIVIQEDELSQRDASLVESIEQLVYAMDRNSTAIQTQFMKHLQAKILVKNIPWNKQIIKKFDNGTVKKSDIPDVIIANDESASLEYISNDNPLADKAMEYEREQIKRISSITSVPVDFLGLNASTGAIGKGSRSLLHGSFIKKVEAIRKVFDKFLGPVYEVMAVNNAWERETYSWPDVFAKDDTELVNELSSAMGVGLISRRDAIMEYRGIGEDEADAELERMSLEDNMIADGDQNNENQTVPEEDAGDDTTRE